MESWKVIRLKVEGLEGVIKICRHNRAWWFSGIGYYKYIASTRLGITIGDCMLQI